MNYTNYIDNLYNNQNIDADNSQKNLVSRTYYENLVFYIDNLLKKNPDASLNELRNIIIKDSKVIEKIRDFCLIKKSAPGMVITIGTKNYQHEFVVGNQEEVIVYNDTLIPHTNLMNYDTIFDLASTTKLFTGVTVFKLVEMGLINLSDDVVKYVPQFTNLSGITIFDLLNFKLLGTDKRVDEAKSREEAESILFTTHPLELKYKASSYNDFSSMVLKYVIEKVSGMDYYSFLKGCVKHYD